MKNESDVFTFIGMSGVGKSYWSKIFTDNGFVIYPIDDMIAKAISKIINKESGDTNVSYNDSPVGDLAKWMGFPGDKRYKRNSKKYLSLESKITSKAVFDAVKSKKNAVIDTTGSAIYIDDKVLQILRAKSKVIYLDTTNKNLRNMFKVFCKFPKPIIWGNIYKAKRNENEESTLKRCYKELLDFRIKKYRKISHTTLPYMFTHKKNLKFGKFLEQII